MTKLECTGKVQKMRHYKTDEEIIKIIGISKPTLYSRLKDHKWKVSEVFLIEKYAL
jgi:predicted DNA-binding transcriptional regulator AlpA